MADNDNAVKILIDFIANTQGADAAVEAMGKLKEASTENAAATEKMTESSGELTQTAGDVGSAIQGLEVSHRGLHKMMHMLGHHTVPQFGKALGAIRFGPLVGGVLAAGFAYEYFHKKIEAVNEELEKLNEKELADHEANVKNVETAWTNAKNEIEKYKQALKMAGEEKDPMAARLKLIQEVSKAQTEANIKEIEEQNKIYVAWLKIHGGTESQIASVEQQGKDTVNAVRDAAANRDIAEIQKDIERRKMRQTDLDPTVEAEANRVGAAHASDELAKAGKTSLEAVNKKKLDDAITKAQEEKEHWEKAEKHSGGASVQQQHIIARGLKQAQSDLETATANSERHAKALAAATKKAEATAKEVLDSESAYANVKTKALENRTRITQEEGEVKTKTALKGVHEKSEKVTQALDKFAFAFERIKDKDPDKIISDSVGAAEDLKELRDQGFTPKTIQADYDLAEKHRLTPGAFTRFDQAAEDRFKRFNDDKAKNDLFNNLMTTLGANAADMIKIIQQHQAGTISQADEIKKLQITNNVIQTRMTEIARGNGSAPH